MTRIGQTTIDKIARKLTGENLEQYLIVQEIINHIYDIGVIQGESEANEKHREQLEKMSNDIEKAFRRH